MAPTPTTAPTPARSAYEVARHHRVIAAALEEVEAGRIKRLIISCPPRHGKTRLASMLFPAWYLGRNPRKSVVFATYNDKYAIDIGGVVKTMMQSPLYAHVFPELELAYGGAATDRLRIAGGGDMFCVGVGGTLTGRGGDINLIDDPIKNRQEADSIVVRDKLWNWYQNVFRTRMMTKDAALVIIATRWNEDDLIGRHIDPTNPYYNEEEAATWKIINLPALAEDDDPLGRPIDEPLWPARFDTKFLLDQRRSDPRGFTALYQGRPTPAEGSFFKSTSSAPTTRCPTCRRSTRMRFYGASRLRGRDQAGERQVLPHGRRRRRERQHLDHAGHRLVAPAGRHVDRGGDQPDGEIQADVLVGREGRDLEDRSARSCASGCWRSGCFARSTRSPRSPTSRRGRSRSTPA